MARRIIKTAGRFYGTMKRRPLFVRFFHGCAIAVVAGGISLLLWYSGALNRLEDVSWDMRVSWLARPGAATDSIALVVLDQYSLDWGAQPERDWRWPWYREIYGAMLSFCRRGGAKAFICDAVFFEPSIHGGDDEAFGLEIAMTPGFVNTVFLTDLQAINTNWPPELAGRELRATGADTLEPRLRAALTAARAKFPVPEVATNAAVLGSVSASPDSDGIFRRITPFNFFDGRFVPSLSLAGYAAGNPAPSIRIDGRTLFVDGHTVPLDRRGRAILRFRGESQTHLTVNAAAVIQSELRIREGGKPTIDPAVFKDKYVVFGGTAPGLMDLKPSPVGRTYPGMEIHATMLDNLLSDDFMRDASGGLVVLFTFAMALAGGIVGRMCQKSWQTVLAFAVLLPLPFVAGLAAYDRGVWLPVVVQEAGMALGLVGALIVNYALEGRQKRFLRSAFKQYISEAYMDRLVEDPEHLRLGGEVRELTIYFSDLAGFTSISETLDAATLTSLLNEYLTAMTTIIYDEGGTIDKYEGDAVIAFWNAPVDLPTHAKNGVRAALKCQKELAALRPHFKDKYGKELSCRIGLNTGEVSVGNMGSIQRFNYTFLGDAGNLASRLEGVNKKFGTDILISEYTLARLGDEFPVREVSRIRVVGKKIPIRIYQPFLAGDFEARRADLGVFDEALRMFYAGRFGDARARFDAVAGRDPVARMYRDMCDRYIASPPESWEGVIDMTEK